MDYDTLFNDYDEVDYLKLSDEILSDVNHVISASVDKVITNFYYSVEFDSDDNSVTIIFEHPIEDQNETVEQIGNEIRYGLNEDIIPEGLHVLFLKHTAIQDIMAEMYAVIFDEVEA